MAIRDKPTGGVRGDDHSRERHDGLTSSPLQDVGGGLRQVNPLVRRDGS